MKLLLIENDNNLLQLLLRQLKREGMLCETAVNYKEGLRKLINFEYDCVVINLTLPGGSGLNLMQQLRENDAMVGIIMISDQNNLDVRVQALLHGADDFLTIPFHPGELFARIKAIQVWHGDIHQNQVWRQCRNHFQHHSTVSRGAYNFVFRLQ